MIQGTDFRHGWIQRLGALNRGHHSSVPSYLQGSVPSVFLHCPAAFPLASSEVTADIFPLSGTLSNPPNSEVPEWNLTSSDHLTCHFCHGFAMLGMALFWVVGAGRCYQIHETQRLKMRGGV